MQCGGVATGLERRARSRRSVVGLADSVGVSDLSLGRMSVCFGLDSMKSNGGRRAGPYFVEVERPGGAVSREMREMRQRRSQRLPAKDRDADSKLGQEKALVLVLLVLELGGQVDWTGHRECREGIHRASEASEETEMSALTQQRGNASLRRENLGAVVAVAVAVAADRDRDRGEEEEEEVGRQKRCTRPCRRPVSDGCNQTPSAAYSSDDR